MMAPEVSEKRSTTRAPERLTRSVMEGLSGRKNFANHDFADRQGLAPPSLVRLLCGAESPHRSQQPTAVSLWPRSAQRSPQAYPELGKPQRKSVAECVP